MHNHPQIHNNPLLFEINTRVWIKRFSQNDNTKLNQIPDEYWQSLKKRGFDYIWLMGVWETSRSSIKKYCFADDLVNEYKKALKDFSDSDVIGSPYSIEDYIVNTDLGSNEDLLALKKQINSFGLKLILDFIPNHFNVESELVNTNPELFLQASEEIFNKDQDTFFKQNNKIFAHGKDPFYKAWKDTIQVNYFSKEAREIMRSKLEHVSQFCDGVRCDMAMLIQNSVFQNTWSDFGITPGNKPESEFWFEAIKDIKEDNPNFLFIAEVYWDKEYEIQQLGFDFTYDKTFLERLKSDDVNEIKSHLWANDDYQKRSVRFLENHDEQRSLKEFGKNKVKAAAVALTTVQGMKLIYDGQSYGKQIKLPVQLGREPKEETYGELRIFYQKLYAITKQNIFRHGRWEPMEPDAAWEGSTTHDNLLVWQWKHFDERALIVINYSDETSHCSLRIDTKNFEDEFPLKDVLNDVEYIRSAKEINNIGLYIELAPYKSHIFLY